jgi:hypothetical protein
MEEIESMFDETKETSCGDGTIDHERRRIRLIEASVWYHRANEAASRSYAETDRLALHAGAPWSPEWCRVVELRGRAALDPALDVCERAGGHWEAMVAEVLGNGCGDSPRSLFTSDEVVALIAFVGGEKTPTL